MIRRVGEDPAGSWLIGRNWRMPVILLGPLLIDGLALSGAGCFANGPTICPSYFGQEKLALLAWKSAPPLSWQPRTQGVR